jgi:hypothetical protein
MKPLKLAIGAALMAGALAAPAFAQAPAPPKKTDVAVYADTVSSSQGAVKQARVCTQTNYFPRRSRVVFRAWAIDGKTGKALAQLDMKYAYIAIPGQPNLKLNWGPHGAVGNKVNFWSAAWAIPADYPLGVVPFRVVFKTADNKFGIYEQPAIESAQLTVTP